MPKISADREAAVRERIIRAAIEVFAEKGYHRATIADVVRRSGLSVGAIYTHFANKDALFLSSCDLVNDQAMEELGRRLAPLATTEARLRAAIDYYVETVDTFDGGPGQAPLVAAWAEADADPGVRAMLVRRRERLVGAATLLLQEGIHRGDLPATLDVDPFARAFTGLLDGLLLQRIEAGPDHRPADLARRAHAVLDVLLAAARQPGAPVPA
jgi:AcrR family transcriptional regulator